MIGDISPIRGQKIGLLLHPPSPLSYLYQHLKKRDTSADIFILGWNYSLMVVYSVVWTKKEIEEYSKSMLLWGFCEIKFDFGPLYRIQFLLCFGMYHCTIYMRTERMLAVKILFILDSM